MFVPPTPGSTLVKQLQQTERLNSQGRTWGIKFIERRGPTITSKISRSYPWQATRCNSQDCFPCTSAAPQDWPPNISCRAPGVAYKIKCMTCAAAGLSSEYQGQTGRNAYSRGQEHIKNLRTGLRHCPLVSHRAAQHPDQAPVFKMEILASFTSPLVRQIEEAARITAGSSNHLPMNSRAEWGSTPIPQLAMTQGRIPPGTRPPDSRPTLHPRGTQDQGQAQQQPALQPTPMPGPGPAALPGPSSVPGAQPGPGPVRLLQAQALAAQALTVQPAQTTPDPGPAQPRLRQDAQAQVHPAQPVVPQPGPAPQPGLPQRPRRRQNPQDPALDARKNP